jgi:O-antigen/teichoic acid export membrane protein
MQKIFLRHSVLYTLSLLVTRGLNIIMLPILTHSLSTTDYGILDYLNLLSTLLITICGLELHQAIARFSSDDNYKANTIISTGLFFISASYALVILFALCFQQFIVSNVIPIPTNVALITVLLNCFMQALVYYISVILRFQLKTKNNIILTTVNATLTLSLTSITILILHLGLNGVICSLLLSNSISAIIGGFFVYEHITIKAFNKKHLNNMLAFSTPLVLSSLSVYLMLYADRIVIKHILGMHYLGIFSVSYRLASVVTIVMAGISASVTPLIYNHLSDPNLNKNVAKILDKTFILGIVAIVLLKLFSFSTLKHFIGVQYLESLKFLPNIAIAIFFSQLYIFAPGLQIKKKTVTIMFINIITALLNLGLAIILTRIYGLAGIAYCSCLCYIIYYALYVLISQKFFYVPANYKKQIIYTLFTLIFVFYPH